MDIEMIMERPYWIIDILPKRVPENSDGEYLQVEQYYLSEPHITALREKLSTDCGDSWLDAPNPDTLEKNIMNCVEAKSLYISISSPECLITIDGCDTYMTVFDSDKELIEILKQLAGAVGLFMWQA